VIWTDERKQKVLYHLKKVNEALAKALDAVSHRNPAEAEEYILDAVAEKHRAIEEFPPLPVNATETVSMGSFFRMLEKKRCSSAWRYTPERSISRLGSARSSSMHSRI